MKICTCVCLAATIAKERRYVGKVGKQDIRKIPEIINLNTRENSIISSCDEGETRKLLEEEIGKY